MTVLYALSTVTITKVVERENVLRWTFFLCLGGYMDYKDTLLMPKTEFEMKANLPTKEPGYVKRWEENNIYNKMLEVHQGEPLYILHDGPPYANGSLHAGTAMNRVIKDFIVKTHAMNGFQTPFFPGWDTHGLPIENAIQKLGHNRKEMSKPDFRNLCEEFARTQIADQKSVMKRLGTFADFDNPYITLNKEFEARQIRSFAKMACDGLIFQGLKPVYWSYAAESACAESEIVYIDKKDPTIFVAFDVKDGKGVLSDAKFVIWTTTPWTIPANLAICLNPRLEYALVKTNKGNLIVGRELVKTLMEKFEIQEYKVVNTYKGSQLEGITTKHPLYDRESLIILGDHVTADDGTGCVHTAPGHGTDDFFIGQKYGLKAYCPVDEKGCMTEEAGEFLKGQHVDVANKTVTTKLDELGHLLKLEFVTHSYPHDDRMKKPIIFRATVQWFASIDKIREKLLDQITNVKWENQWGEARLYNMIKERGDWCISRQRVWGVPIPIIYEDKKPMINHEIFENIAKMFEEKGSNVWFELDAEELLPADFVKDGCEYTKETDIMDVWFDSGSSFNELSARGLPYPCDIYFEGQDQYRGWFNSSLIVATATTGVAPYKSVLSHGYVNDAKGFKMSKSVGNVVNPMDIMNKNGADVFRYWAASVDFKQDMRIGDDMIKQISDNYRKVRNYFRFMLGNINPSDFNYQNDLVDYQNLEKVDKYLLVKLNKINSDVKESYMKYNYLEATSNLFTFMTNILSAFYLDFTKDILYIEKKDALRRRQVQTVLYHCVNTLSRLWAPILSFTMEEIWDTFGKNQSESIFLQSFMEDNNLTQEQLVKDFERFTLIKADVFKALEDAREEKVIGKSLEAKVKLNLSNEDKELLEQLFTNIPQMFIVSQLEFTGETLKQYDICQVEVEKATGEVCPRCWNISINDNPDHLCPRCHEILS